MFFHSYFPERISDREKQVCTSHAGIIILTVVHSRFPAFFVTVPFNFIKYMWRYPHFTIRPTYKCAVAQILTMCAVALSIVFYGLQKYIQRLAVH